MFERKYCSQLFYEASSDAAGEGGGGSSVRVCKCIAYDAIIANFYSKTAHIHSTGRHALRSDNIKFPQTETK